MEERNRAWEGRLNESRGVFGGTRLEKSNSDRVPIMEDQDADQDVLLDTVSSSGKRAPKINNSTHSPVPMPEYSNYLQQPTEQEERSSPREKLIEKDHPAPSSIFDDL